MLVVDSTATNAGNKACPLKKDVLKNLKTCFVSKKQTVTVDKF